MLQDYRYISCRSCSQFDSLPLTYFVYFSRRSSKEDDATPPQRATPRRELRSVPSLIVGTAEVSVLLEDARAALDQEAVALAAAKALPLVDCMSVPKDGNARVAAAPEAAAAAAPEVHSPPSDVANARTEAATEEQALRLAVEAEVDAAVATAESVAHETMLKGEVDRTIDKGLAAATALAGEEVSAEEDTAGDGDSESTTDDEDNLGADADSEAAAKVATFFAAELEKEKAMSRDERRQSVLLMKRGAPVDILGALAAAGLPVDVMVEPTGAHLEDTSVPEGGNARAAAAFEAAAAAASEVSSATAVEDEQRRQSMLLLPPPPSFDADESSGSDTDASGKS